MAASAKPTSSKKEKVPTAVKRAQQNRVQRGRNQSFKSRVRTATRALEQAIEAKEGALSQQKLSLLYSLMDKGVKRGIFKPNKAARTKARLAKRSLSS